jgi:murein DD-endopeptidase MepM/ murein hydrolase activator NlpD
MKRAAASALLWLLFGCAASACESLDNAEAFSLKTRKPVLGDEVHLTYGFGARRDPRSNTVRFHTGVDWAAPRGTSVVAALGGRVESAKADHAYGKAVVIDHGAVWKTRYAHLDSFEVQEGDCVRADTIIGRIGSTGSVNGPALHFEVLRNGMFMDPLRVPAKSPGD